MYSMRLAAWEAKLLGSHWLLNAIPVNGIWHRRFARGTNVNTDNITWAKYLATCNPHDKVNYNYVDSELRMIDYGSRFYKYNLLIIIRVLGLGHL